MPNQAVTVYIVDDEPSICTAYSRLVRSANMQAKTFTSVEEFLGSDFSDENACVISDVQFPGKSGLQLTILLGRAGFYLPVIYVTAHDTPETRELAFRVGGVAYFRKPVEDHDLLEAIAQAVSGKKG